MKIYFNTKAFDCLEEKVKLDITHNLSEAEMAVLGAKTIDFGAARNLKAVYRFGVGRENIPEEISQKGRVQVFFPSPETKNVLFESTANFTVFLILKMYFSDSLGTIEPWIKNTRFFLGNKILLVVGMGNIGHKVYEKMKPLMKAASYDVLHNKPGDLKPLLSQADVVSLHIPLSNETKEFLDAEKLSWMKKDAILVNTARGALVNENALYDKIANSDFKAAFDVFWDEPYNGKLKTFPRNKFFMTPHTSSQTLEYVKSGFNDILKMINQFKK